LASIKTQSRISVETPTEEIDTAKITVDVQSAKLKQLLGKIKSNQ